MVNKLKEIAEEWAKADDWSRTEWNPCEVKYYTVTFDIESDFNIIFVAPPYTKKEFELGNL